MMNEKLERGWRSSEPDVTIVLRRKDAPLPSPSHLSPISFPPPSSKRLPKPRNSKRLSIASFSSLNGCSSHPVYPSLAACHSTPDAVSCLGYPRFLEGDQCCPPRPGCRGSLLKRRSWSSSKATLIVMSRCIALSNTV